MVPFLFTKGDGNEWFRAMAEQVALLKIKDKPVNHKQMRLNVALYVLHELPLEVKERRSSLQLKALIVFTVKENIKCW